MKLQYMYFEHLIRHNNLASTLLQGNISEKISRARPWMDYTLQHGQDMDMKQHCSKISYRYRRRWKFLISSNPVIQDAK